MKDAGDGGRHIVLHHAYIVKPESFLNILAGYDESSFHFLHCFATVTLLDASMVGSQYENSVIKDACIFTAWTIWPT